MDNAVHTEDVTQLPEVQEESSWEVFSTDGESELSESGQESLDEDSGDEVLRHRDRKRAALS